MAEAKTKPTQASVDDYIAAKANEAQRADCTTLMAMLRNVTQHDPKMWGASIVGYGLYRYTYASGHKGESCLIRGKERVVYLVAEGAEQQDLLAKLGKHKMGKACLYIRRLSDIDLTVLEKLVVGSVAEIACRYGT